MSCKTQKRSKNYLGRCMKYKKFIVGYKKEEYIQAFMVMKKLSRKEAESLYSLAKLMGSLSDYIYLVDLWRLIC